MISESVHLCFEKKFGADSSVIRDETHALCLEMYESVHVHFLEQAGHNNTGILGGAGGSGISMVAWFGNEVPPTLRAWTNRRM